MNFFFSDFLNRACWCFEILEISIDEVFLFRVQADGFLHVFYRAFLVSFQQSGSSPFLIESGIFRHQFNGFCIVLDGSIQLFQFDVKLSFQQVGIFVALKGLFSSTWSKALKAASLSPKAAWILPFSSNASSFSGWMDRTRSMSSSESLACRMSQSTSARSRYASR